MTNKIISEYTGAIRRFHKMRHVVSISSSAADLYFILVEECHNHGWKNPFCVETKRIEEHLGISRVTICKARKELETLDLIKFKEGKNSCTSPCYVLTHIEVGK